jgi:hypothetical protein
VFSITYEVVLAGLVAVLLLASLVRWGRTPESHPDHQARGDMTRLLALILLGLVGAMVRARLLLGGAGFWLLSLALLPIAGAALFLIWRLFGAYRQSGSAPPLAPSPPPTDTSDRP